MTPAHAQILLDSGSEDVDKKPMGTIDQSAPKKKVGEGAARQYFKERNQSEDDDEETSVRDNSKGTRYMAIQLGSFMSDTQYRWGEMRREDDVGELTLGVTYRMGEWVNSMDLMGRVEYQIYDIDDEKPKKLSLMPMITFPDVKGDFPLYFGAGAGLGIFFDQAPDESELSLDYQIIAGARFMNMFPTGGLIIETGLKGHFHLLGSGQFNGTFLSVGGAFTF
ncbi:MAG: hypothetical protein AABZ31_04325 [Bdellovibrionota bacterium]